VGRLDLVKDHATLLDAFARIHTHDGGATWLVLAGDGSERSRLTDLAERLGIEARTLFLGHRDDIPRVLAACDVFALSSLTEGMSNALLEAMGTGLACVATRVGGNDEVIDEGETGFLVPSRDPAALAVALRHVVSDPALCAELGAAGRRRVSAEFSLATMASRYESLYASLARGEGIPHSLLAVPLEAETTATTATN
jgi:glycosyltransferase involved in cell wall biosynthesis